MPRGDGTGPRGQGSMTGRRMGYCSGFNTPGFMNGGFRRGMGFGRGFAWRARKMQVMPTQQPEVITENQEKEMLETDLSNLKAEVKQIEERLKELKN
jgi:hypothetical protein